MSETDALPVFPFLVGCPRSGTTLVRAMFDTHPLLAIPAESHFIVTMADDRERYERPDGFVLETFVRDLTANERFALWQLPEEATRAAVASAEPRTLAEAFRAVYAAYAAARGKPLHGDKTPGYVRRLPLLAEMFPEARFVHIVRDGRDVALSLEQVEWGRRQAPEGLKTFAEFWCTNLELAFAARTALGPERYLELRYEDLLDDPERALRAACAFLGLPFVPAMLDYHERSAEMSRTLRQPGDHAHVGRPVTKGLRDWRTQMTVEQIALFESIAGDMLERAGYPLAS